MVTSKSPRLTFHLLGDLEVRADGIPISLGSTKQRAVLAVLLLERGRPVSTDRLIDALWADRPPATANKSVQVYISGLRKAIGESRILTRGGGYELVMSHGDSDLDRFDELTASGDLAEALALVRGRPLADLALEPWAAPEIAKIEERVLAVSESRIAADLDQGKHAEHLLELEELVNANPYRERLLELLMIALYRSGRQADALAAYRRGVARLRDDLGLEPGPSLRRTETAVLQQSAALEPPTHLSGIARRRGWRLAVAGGAVLVLAGVAAAAIAVSRDGETSPLASLPPGVAIVSSNDGSLIAQLPLSEIGEPVEVFTGNGHFWVSNLDPPSTFEIKPANGAVARRIGSVFPGEPGFPLPRGRVVWFTEGAELVRVNGAEGRDLVRYQLTPPPKRLGLAGNAECFGSLWVADNEESALLRIDPASGKVKARIVTQSPVAVLCSQADVWVTADGVGVQRVDPHANRIVATARVPYPNVTLAVGGGFAWTSNETNGTVYKIDRNGTIVATYETGDGARQLSFAAGRVWVANQDVGTVTGIDAATGELRTFAFRHPVQAVAAAGSALAVVLGSGATYEDEIGALTGKVARLIVPVYVFDPQDPALANNPVAFMAERASCSELVAPRPGSPDQLVPDLAQRMPSLSADRRTYTFTLRRGVRFAPPSTDPVTPNAVRFSIERALSPKLGADVPGKRFLSDVVGAPAFTRGAVPHIRGIRIAGDTITFTLTRPSATFLQRVSLPFFCTVPTTTPVALGGVTTVAPPSAGPYYMSNDFNGEFMILKRNPNYTGPHPAKLDAIAFREGISPEHAVARVRSGKWDAAILPDELLAPGGAAARDALANPATRTEELSGQETAFGNSAEPLHALVSSRLSCDAIPGAIDLAVLCLRHT